MQTNWMTLEETTAYLKCSKEKLYKLAQKRKIPSAKFAGKWVFNRVKLDEWLLSKSKMK